MLFREMPKKQPKNAYFYFMLDFKAREERRGRKFPNGMNSVAIAAAEEWKCIPPHKKEYYTRLAKERKNDPRPMKKKYCNNQGISLTQLEREKEEEERKLYEINRFVDYFVNEIDFETLTDQMFYLIHVNYFCKTDNEVYYPAELAIVKFNLRLGVRSIFHRYVNPGEIATGYSFTVKEHADMTHKITLSFVKSIDNADNLLRMYNDIIQFLLEEDTDKSRSIPPLFTMHDDIFFNTSMTAVKKTLQRLWESAFPHSENDDSWKNVFKVYPLPLLLWRLKNRCYSCYENERMAAFPNSEFAKCELERDTYNFDMKTACSFHQSEDVIPMCSRSYVLRWAFIIRDNCCPYLDIETYGQHENFDMMMLKSGDSVYNDDIDDSNQNIKTEKNIKKEKEDFDGQTIKKEKQDCGCQTIKKEKEDSVNQNIKKEKEDSASPKIKKEREDSVSQNIKKEKEDSICPKIKKEKEDYISQNIKKEKEDTANQNIKKENEDSVNQNIEKEKTNDNCSFKIKEEVFDPSTVKIKEEKVFDYEPEVSQSTNSCPVAWPHQGRKTKNNGLTIIDGDFPALGFGNEKRIKLEIKEEKVEAPAEDFNA